MKKKEAPLSAAEWGAKKAAEAPPWTDKMWREACAILGVRVAEPPPTKIH